MEFVINDLPTMSVNRYVDEEDQRIVLKEFRRAIQDILQPHHDDKFLLRWLRARDFDVPKSERMIRESFKYRKKINADDLLTKYELPEVYRKHKISECLGFDKDYSVIRLFMAGICDYKGFVYSLPTIDLLKVIMHLLESDMKLVEDRKKKHEKYEEKATFILDFQSFNLRQFYDRSVINAGVQVLTMYQDNYPETLKVAYLVNVPSYFNWIFNIFKPFLNAVTLSKIKIYRSDEWKQELLKHIDSKKLPAFLGGTLTDSDGDPQCNSVINWNSKIPASYYMKSNKCIEADEPGMKTTTIQQRSSFECPVIVQQPGTVIKWIFQTKDYNIRFGLFYKSGRKSSLFKNRNNEELLPLDTVDCQVFPERGDFTCEKPGQYILHFDNSYSWLTAKQLVYKVEVEEPESSKININ